MANKCPACNKAELILESGMYRCENCGNSFSLDAIEKYSNNYEETKENTITVNSYQYIKCKKNFTSFSDKIYETCPYCGEHIIIKEDILRKLHPQKMIKFKVTQDEAIKKFKRYIKRRIFFPKFFNLKEIKEKVVGMYIPFEICDCDVDAKINFWCTKLNIKRFIGISEAIKNFKAEGIYTRNYRTCVIKKYIATRNGKIKFENILKPSPKYDSNEFINSIQPFDCKELVEFDENLFGDFLIDNTEINQKNMKELINELVQNMTYNEFVKLVQNMAYNEFINLGQNMTHDVFGELLVGKYRKIEIYDSEIKINYKKFENILLPVYFAVIEDDRGCKYNFAMNGQTGKIAGIIPKSKRKMFIKGISVFSAIELILSCAKYFLNMNISKLGILTIAIISTIIFLVIGCLMHKREGKYKNKYYKKGSLQCFNKMDTYVAEKTFRGYKLHDRPTGSKVNEILYWLEEHDDIEKKWDK